MTAEQIVMFLAKLLAGTGVFLVGVHLMTGNIEQLATGKIKKLFGKTADKKIINAGIGAATTALVQSSGVTTVLIVGFVNVGIMSLSQATAMIMGANIGTTITGLMASLSSFDFTTYIQALAFVGVFVSMLTKNDNVKKISLLTAGLALVFIGLKLMSASMEGYREQLQQVFSGIDNSFLLFALGVFLTALVQSSSATTSIVIAMSIAGASYRNGRQRSAVLYPRNKRRLVRYRAYVFHRRKRERKTHKPYSSYVQLVRVGAVLYNAQRVPVFYGPDVQTMVCRQSRRADCNVPRIFQRRMHGYFSAVFVDVRKSVAAYHPR